MTTSTLPPASLPPILGTLLEAPVMSSLDLVSQGSRVVLARHVALLYQYQDDVRHSDDVHAVHQMRVATRRIRSVLKVNAGVFRPKALKPFQKPLRHLAGLLGTVRDGDVLLGHLQAEQVPGSPDDQAAFAAFIEHAQQERDAAAVTLRHELGSKHYARLLEALVEFLTAPLDEVARSQGMLPLMVRYYAGSRILERYELARRYEAVLPTATTNQLHTLRIVTKQLRYTLELFEAPLGTNAPPLLKIVRSLQEDLGDIHDADVAVDYARTYLHKQGTIPAVLNYIERRTVNRDAAVARLPELWSKFTGENFRKTLGRALATL